VCIRLRFGLQTPRTKTVGLFTVLLAAGLRLEIGNAQPGDNGCCPQSSDGWLLFEDSNPRVPDFWRRDSVVVDVIDVCRHGINCYFVSEEDGQPRYVALIIVKPSQELYETRVIRRVGDTPLETCLERAQRNYADLVAALEQLFEIAFSPEGRIDFTNHTLESRPVISRCRGLTIRWRGNEVKLRGYLDVYMTMFS
jgi:hypothetical protein